MTGLVQGLMEQGEWVVFAVVLAEQMGLPLPSMIVLIFGGAMAGLGQWSGAAVFVLASGAALAANQVWYLIGRAKGPRVLALLCRVSLDPNVCVRLSQNLVGRLGLASLLIAKFIPGLGTLTPPLLGVLRMNPWRFLAFNAVGTAGWVAAFLALGYRFRDQVEQITLWIGRIGMTLGAVFGILLAGWVGFKLLQRMLMARRGRAGRIGVEALREKLKSGARPLILDLRHVMEDAFNPHRIPGAEAIKPRRLRRRVKSLPRNHEIVVYCS